MQARIQSIRLKNFRTFKSIDLKICSDEDIRKITLLFVFL